MNSRCKRWMLAATAITAVSLVAARAAVAQQTPQDKPLVTPTMATIYGMPECEPDDFIVANRDLPSAESILEKYIQTSGGAPAQSHVVDVVQGNGPRGTFVTLYFDQKTNLLLRELRHGNSPIGRVPTQIDYRDVNGIKLAFRITYAWLDGRDSIVLNGIKTNVPVDEAKFGRPAPLKRP